MDGLRDEFEQKWRGERSIEHVVWGNRRLASTHLILARIPNADTDRGRAVDGLTHRRNGGGLRRVRLQLAAVDANDLAAAVARHCDARGG